MIESRTFIFWPSFKFVVPECPEWAVRLQPPHLTRSSDNNALIQPESRQAFARLLAQGWTDAIVVTGQHHGGALGLGYGGCLKVSAYTLTLAH